MRIGFRCRRAAAVGVAVSLVLLLRFADAWAAQLSGQVVHADGKPAAKASIQVQDGPQVIADGGGGYLLDLPPGSYVLRVGGQVFKVDVPASGKTENLTIP